MISIVIPTLDAARTLPLCLNALLPAVTNLVKEVIVVDGGSTDATTELADAAGARVVAMERGRGRQLAAGGALARGGHVLFLHADTVLDPGWERAAAAFVERQGEAATFTLAFDARGLAPRLVASGANFRSRVFGLPYGDQGLLIRADVYREVGEYQPLPLMEDVEFMRRFLHARGRQALEVLQPRAITSFERYERSGVARRVLSNQWRLLQFHLGVDPAEIAKGYERK